MINVSYDEFQSMIKFHVEAANEKRNRKVKLAIEMLEFGVDRDSVSCILKKILEEK